MEVYQSNGSICLSQHRHLWQFLETYGMTGCKPFLVPWIHNPSFLMKNILPCLKIVWSTGGWLDHSFTLPTQGLIYPTRSTFSQFLNAPCQVHLQVAICVLWYLACTNDYGLSFRGGNKLIDYLGTYCPGDVDTRQSSGYFFLHGASLMITAFYSEEALS